MSPPWALVLGGIFEGYQGEHGRRQPVYQRWSEWAQAGFLGDIDTISILSPWNWWPNLLRSLLETIYLTICCALPLFQLQWPLAYPDESFFFHKLGHTWEYYEVQYPYPFDLGRVKTSTGILLALFFLDPLPHSPASPILPSCPLSSMIEFKK